jgi:hypothetical protein
VGVVVDGEEQVFSSGGKTADQESRPTGEQFALQPGGGTEEIVVEMNTVFALRVGEGIEARNGAPDRTEDSPRDEANAGDEGWLGENRFEHDHESKHLGKFGHGTLLLQGVPSVPGKRIAMSFINSNRMTPMEKPLKVHKEKRADKICRPCNTRRDFRTQSLEAFHLPNRTTILRLVTTAHFAGETPYLHYNRLFCHRPYHNRFRQTPEIGDNHFPETTYYTRTSNGTVN